MTSQDGFERYDQYLKGLPLMEVRQFLPSEHTLLGECSICSLGWGSPAPVDEKEADDLGPLARYLLDRIAEYVKGL
jgi:hypothetical protein